MNFDKKEIENKIGITRMVFTAFISAAGGVATGAKASFLKPFIISFCNIEALILNWFTGYRGISGEKIMGQKYFFFENVQKF